MNKLNIICVNNNYVMYVTVNGATTEMIIQETVD